MKVDIVSISSLYNQVTNYSGNWVEFTKFLDPNVKHSSLQDPFQSIPFILIEQSRDSPLSKECLGIELQETL